MNLNMNCLRYTGKIVTLCIAFLSSSSLSAQIAEQKLCDFESANSYTSISVYDTWENSPFRNGTLSGNVRVVANHLTDIDPIRGFAPNPSSKDACLAALAFWQQYLRSTCRAEATNCTNQAHTVYTR